VWNYTIPGKKKDVRWPSSSHTKLCNPGGPRMHGNLGPARDHRAEGRTRRIFRSTGFAIDRSGCWPCRRHLSPRLVGVASTIRRGKIRAGALTQLPYEPFMPFDKNSKTSRAFACHSSPPGKSPSGSWRVMIMGFSESQRRTSTRSSEFLIST